MIVLAALAVAVTPVAGYRTRITSTI